MADANGAATELVEPQLSLQQLSEQANLPWMLLDGEFLCDLETPFAEVSYFKNNVYIKGRLYITNFRFYFKSDEPLTTAADLDKSYEMCNGCFEVENVPLGLVQRVEKLYAPTAANASGEQIGLVVSCKNGCLFKFLKLPDDKNNNFERQASNFQRFAFPLSNKLVNASLVNLFAFSYKPYIFEDGWMVYDAEQEYERMGVLPSSNWRLTKLNSNYAFCDTYPSVLAVPAVASDKELEFIAQFRSKNRVPVLSWLRSSRNGGAGGDRESNGAALCRSAQPLCGMAGKRNMFDELYLKQIADMSSGEKILHVLDARPYLNALANYTTGGGYENEKYYHFCRVSFLNIENIHSVRDSLSGGNNELNFFANVQTSNRWLENLKTILDGVQRIVALIESNANVLVHCSDGWDRTSQLTSLSMVILDKYYRTIKGFEVLVEKEWISFGHHFEMRMGHGSDKYADQDRSPIFLQFIDCVWQLMQQNKAFFEFNEKFLLEILDNMYTCQFGTFLFNSERERVKNDVVSKTVSFWSFINSDLSEFKNKDYIEYGPSLKFSTEHPGLKLWTNYYMRHRHSHDNCTLPATVARTSAEFTSVTLFEQLTPNAFLSNSYRLFNHIKSNLKS